MTWTREAIRTELLVVLKEHAQTGVDITEKSHLVADLGIDSLGLMEVIAAVEDKFGIVIPDDSLRDVETIADVAKALELKLGGEGRLQG